LRFDNYLINEYDDDDDDDDDDATTMTKTITTVIRFFKLFTLLPSWRNKVYVITR